MTKSTWFAATALGACVTLFACSSTSSGGGDAAVSYGAYTGCIEGEAPQACTSCLENSCGTQLSNFESACTDYLQCICPGGTYSDTAAQSTTCQMKGSSDTTCANADTGLTECLNTSCTSECGTVGDAGDGDVSTDGSTTGTPACGVSWVSPTCASCVMSSCCTQTMTCTGDAACTGIITCQQACASTDTTCQNACVTSASTSAQSEYNNLGNCLQTSCSNSGC